MNTVMEEGESGETAPSLRVTGEDGREQQPQCTVRFQCGLLREMETFQGELLQYLSAETLLYYVCDMLQYKV